MPIKDKRENFRPFEYDKAYEFTKAQNDHHWTHSEIEVDSDLVQYHTEFTEAEKHGINTVLKLFTRYELRVGNYWTDVVYNRFPKPEVRMMAQVMGAMEVEHALFYDKLNEAIGLNDKKFHLSFLDDPAMKKRDEFIGKMLNLGKSGNDEDLALALATFSLVEGVILYSSFAFLLSFQRQARGKLKNVAGTGLAYSVRDECLVEGTEVLTPKGWVDLANITTDDKVAQYDINTKHISFVNPSRVVENYVEEEVINFSSSKLPINQTVTKNHRMVIESSKTGESKFVLADKVNKSSYNYYPVSGYKKDGKAELTDLERFYILTQADGYVSDRYTGERCGTRPVSFTFSKERKVSRFLMICNKLNFNVKECNPTEPSGNSKGKRSFKVDVPLELFVNMKNFDWVDLSSVSSSWCEQFIEELSKWDGHIPSDNKAKYIYYSSTVKSNVEKVQAIASLCGKQAVLSVQVDDKSDNFSDVFRLYIHDKNTKCGSSVEKSNEYYKGYVRCVTVPTGAFLIRYKGSVSVTGNCLHADAGSWLFNTFVDEYNIDRKIIEKRIKQVAKESYELEKQIIENIFSKGSIEGITERQLKNFVKSRINKKLNDIGIEQFEKVTYNPIAKWFYKVINSIEVADFFNQNSTNYSNHWNFGKIKKW